MDGDVVDATNGVSEAEWRRSCRRLPTIELTVGLFPSSCPGVSEEADDADKVEEEDARVMRNAFMSRSAAESSSRNFCAAE